MVPGFSAWEPNYRSNSECKFKNNICSQDGSNFRSTIWGRWCDLISRMFQDVLKNKNFRKYFHWSDCLLLWFMLLQKLKMSCNESYVDVDPSNTACVAALGAYEIVNAGSLFWFFFFFLFFTWLVINIKASAFAVYKRFICQWYLGTQLCLCIRKWKSTNWSKICKRKSHKFHPFTTKNSWLMVSSKLPPLYTLHFLAYFCSFASNHLSIFLLFAEF